MTVVSLNVFFSDKSVLPSPVKKHNFYQITDGLTAAYYMKFLFVFVYHAKIKMRFLKRSQIPSPDTYLFQLQVINMCV